MYSYGLAFGIESEQLEDAIHDVFLSLYENDCSLWKSNNKKFYMLTCLKNQIRTMKRRVVNFEEISDNEDYDFMLELSGLEIIEQEEEREAMILKLQMMMNNLTDRQREAIYLRYTNENSFEEISEHFNIKTKTAQKLVYRAIEKLRIGYQSKLTFFALICIFKHIFWGI